MAENKIKVRLQSAYKTESEWTASNPILKEGEVGYVADSNVPNYARYKIGDGVTNWNGLKWGDQSIYDKVDGIEIGGRNLLLGTKDFSGWGIVGNSAPILDEDGFYYTEVINTWSKYIYEFIGVEVGKYVISFYAKASSTANLEIKDDSKNNIVLKIIPINSTEWKKYEAIISITDITNTPKITFLTRQANISIFIKKLKLEKGNKATDWTPAPEDKADVSHTHSTSDITSGTLSSDRLPTIPVSKGGTGLTSLTSGQALIGNGTGNITTRAIDTTSGGTSGSTSLITSGAVYSGLSGKANSSHTHSYLPLSGGTMSGDLKFSHQNGSIAWDNGTYRQRIQTTDDSTSGTNVFQFQQSSDSGSTWTDLLVIKDTSEIVATKFTGELNGNANTATTATNLKGFTNTTTTATAIDSATQNGHVYVNGTSDIYSQSDGAAFVQAYSTSWVAQIYQDYRTGQIALRGKNSGTWQAWRKVLDSENYTSYVPTKTGSGASGTWGISVSGNASTATKSSQDASGNTITSSYAASLSVSGQTLTLKSKSGATLSTVTTQDTTYNPVTQSSNGLMIASDKIKLDGLIPLTDAEIDDLFNEATSGIEELDSIYPVGSVYISINNANPGTIFGGTWERFGNGKVLVGVDENDTDFSTAEQSGGGQWRATRSS